MLQSVGEVQVAPSDPVQAHIDAAVELYHQGDLVAARTEIEAALRVQKKSALAHYWSGMIDLRENRTKQAEKAFKRGIRYDKKLAEPHNGLGQVYRLMKYRNMDAIEAFKRALELNPHFSDAQYNLARVYLYLSFGRDFSDDLSRPVERQTGIFGPGYMVLARKALLRTLELAPDHQEANHDLGMLYEYGLLNAEKAIPFYLKQLQIDPNRPETAKQLGLVYFKTERYQEGIKTLTALIRQSGSMATAIQSMVTMLQASLALQNKQFARAAALYENYLRTLPVEEQALYEDIAVVASTAEQQAYDNLSATERMDYRRQFWKRKDPDPTTTVNERLVEHYRRVVFARNHFGVQEFPWDRRGEIYIRYGAPDDRQVFTFGVGEQQGITGPAAEKRDRAEEIRDQALNRETSSYATTGSSRVDAIRERNQRLRYQLRVEASTSSLSAHKVESWVYVAMSMELFFVDQLNAGVFDYPLPTGAADVRQMARQGEYHPANLARKMIEKAPELYRHDFGGEPMRFYFDPVAFQGEGNMSVVDVAVAVPMTQLGTIADGKGAETGLDSRVVMTDAEWQDIASAYEHVGPFTRPQKIRSTEARTALTTFHVPVSTLPGEYTMGVSVRDEATRRIGVYRQPVSIASFTSPDLLISGIRLASSIVPTLKLRDHFVRHGLEIIPNPTRAYARNYPVYIYYELYNLHQDENGDTSFHTEITVRTRRATPSSPASGFDRLATSADQALTFSISDASQSATTARYTALDLSDAPPGRYTVEITVKDLHVNRTVRKTAGFAITDEMAGEAPRVSRWSEQDPADMAVSGVNGDSDSASTATEITASAVPDTGASTRHAWDDLLRILQTPQYTTSGDSGQTVARDTTISMFVGNLSENLNQSRLIGDFEADDEDQDMVYVPAGMFLMGSDSTNADEWPMQGVFTEAFYIDRTEVTNEAYKRFLDTTGHVPPRHWELGAFPPGEARYPVIGVSWYDAQAYAQWAGKRLPTETEWEKAARGDDGRRYPWGDVFIPDWLNIQGDTDAYEMTALVGSFPGGASPYGALDMAGNVWEWTSDWFEPYDGNEVIDPAYGEQYRVIRGGSWINYDGNTRSANRGKFYPSDTSLLLGFRCVRDPKATSRLSTTGYGYLFIVTPDTWADIYVDGEKLGQTPRADPLRLRPGQYILQLKNPYYKDYHRNITVDPDGRETVQAVLVRKPGGRDE